MKITFEDKSFLDVRNNDQGKVVVTIGSRVTDATQQKIISASTAIITLEQFQEIVKELSSPAQK
jgi:hypothetical protein